MRTPLTHETAGTCSTLMNVVLFEVVTLADVTDVNPVGLTCPPMDLPYSKGQSLSQVKESYFDSLLSKINAPTKVTLQTFMEVVAPGLDAISQYTAWAYQEVLPTIHEGMWSPQDREADTIPAKVQEHLQSTSDEYLSLPSNARLKESIEAFRAFIEKATGVPIAQLHLLAFPNPEGYTKYSPVVLHFISWLEVLRSTIEESSNSSFAIAGHPRSYELNFNSLNKAYDKLTAKGHTPECPAHWFYLTNSEVDQNNANLDQYSYRGDIVQAIPVALIKLHMESPSSYKENRDYTSMFAALVDSHLTDVLPAVAARKAAAIPSPIATPYMGGNVVDMSAYRKSLN